MEARQGGGVNLGVVLAQLGPAQLAGIFTRGRHCATKCATAEVSLIPRLALAVEESVIVVAAVCARDLDLPQLRNKAGGEDDGSAAPLALEFTYRRVDRAGG
jgi:hypothetical protein